MLGSYMLSLIRTYVPLAVGAALTWIALNLGVVLDEDSTATVVVGAVILVTAVYYAAARAIERQWPKLSVLLSLTTKAGEPVYARTASGQAKRLPRM